MTEEQGERAIALLENILEAVQLILLAEVHFEDEDDTFPPDMPMSS
jgi:hypothetical protein